LKKTAALPTGFKNCKGTTSVPFALEKVGGKAVEYIAACNWGPATGTTYATDMWVEMDGIPCVDANAHPAPN